MQTCCVFCVGRLSSSGLSSQKQQSCRLYERKTVVQRNWGYEFYQRAQCTMIVEEFCEATIFKNTTLFQFRMRLHFEIICTRSFCVHVCVCFRTALNRNTRSETTGRLDDATDGQRAKQPTHTHTSSVHHTVIHTIFVLMRQCCAITGWLTETNACLSYHEWPVFFNTI